MKRLLVIGNNWPEPTTTAAGTRLLQLLKIFQSDGYEVHFASAAAKSDYSVDLTALNITEQEIKLNNSSFDTYIQKLQPNVVLYDRFMMEEQYSWRVKENAPHTKHILDTEDLHFLRKAREEAFKKNNKLNLYTEVAMREIAAIHRCDLSLIISLTEYQLLLDAFDMDASKVFYIPFLIDQKEILAAREKATTFSERSHMVMIGNSLHKPNYDAIFYMKKFIWPKIRKNNPNVEVHVYGAYQNQAIHQLNDIKLGFIIKGYAVDAVETISKYRLLLASLRFGAGQKGKIFDAMKANTPVAMTSIAAEGMFNKSDAYGFVEDNSEVYASKCLEVYNNENAWYALSGKNLAIWEEFYLYSAFAKALLEKVQLLFSYKNSTTLDSSFSLQMLVYHSQKANKYLSKWIEEKNAD